MGDPSALLYIVDPADGTFLEETRVASGGGVWTKEKKRRKLFASRDEADVAVDAIGPGALRDRVVVVEMSKDNSALAIIETSHTRRGAPVYDDVIYDDIESGRGIVHQWETERMRIDPLLHAAYQRGRQQGRREPLAQLAEFREVNRALRVQAEVLAGSHAVLVGGLREEIKTLRVGQDGPAFARGLEVGRRDSEDTINDLRVKLERSEQSVRHIRGIKESLERDVGRLSAEQEAKIDEYRNKWGRTAHALREVQNSRLGVVDRVLCEVPVDDPCGDDVAADATTDAYFGVAR